MAISGKALVPLTTKLYVSARLIVMTRYLAPCVSCSKDHLSSGSCSIQSLISLICVPVFLLVLSGSNPSKL
jgi:hypothetical protein